MLFAPNHMPLERQRQKAEASTNCYRKPQGHSSPFRGKQHQKLNSLSCLSNTRKIVIIIIIIIIIIVRLPLFSIIPTTSALIESPSPSDAAAASIAPARFTPTSLYTN
jgi:hypothetical protein